MLTKQIIKIADEQITHQNIANIDVVDKVLDNVKEAQTIDTDGANHRKYRLADNLTRHN